MTGQDMHRSGASERAASPHRCRGEGPHQRDVRRRSWSRSAKFAQRYFDVSQSAQQGGGVGGSRKTGESYSHRLRSHGADLDFTRIHLGRGIPIEREEVDLSEISHVVIDELEAAHGCSIRFEHAGDLVGFWDRDRLSKLLSTLGGNACQHRGAATPVLVRVDGTQARMVMLEVWNEGVIPKNLLPVIFDPMQVGTGKRREGINALGLGLYVSQQIVVAHGGTIHVESCEEKGTRFVVGLPRHSR